MQREWDKVRRATRVLLMGCLLGAASTGETPVRTVSTDPGALQQLEGTHRLTLQWIGWDKPGEAEVTRDGELLSVRGRQAGKQGDLLELHGVVERVDARSFVMVGRIETRVSYIAGGRTCARQGRFTFRVTGKRRYWRLAEMDNPCEGVVDYVDIYLR